MNIPIRLASCASVLYFILRITAFLKVSLTLTYIHVHMYVCVANIVAVSFES